MDNFKKFCYDNKDSMDVDLPGAAVWLNIEQKLITSKKGRLVSGSFIYRVAAAFVIVTAAWVYYYVSTGQPEPVATTVSYQSPPPLSTLPNDAVKNETAVTTEEESLPQPADKKVLGNPKYFSAIYEPKEKRISKQPNSEEKVFSDMQSSYGQMVSYQLEKVRHTPIYAENADYFILFKTQFSDLDKDEKLLRADIKQTGVNDDIIMRMINIYQEKIVLLKELQSEIIKMNNRYKSTVQDSVNLSPSFIKL